MKPNPPSKLEHYRYDQTSSQTPLLARVLGWLTIFAFVIAVYSSIFLSGEQMMMCYVSYGGFISLFSAYVIVRILKRHPRCSQCQQVMNEIAVRWTPDQFRKILGYEGGFNGADGYLYTTERTKDTGSSPYCSIWTQLQIWCVCHQCRVYFLKAQLSREKLFATRSDDEFEQAKHALLTDLNAREKMELTYKAVRYPKM